MLLITDWASANVFFIKNVLRLFFINLSRIWHKIWQKSTNPIFVCVWTGHSKLSLTSVRTFIYITDAPATKMWEIKHFINYFQMNVAQSLLQYNKIKTFLDK